jgi:arylsulfatase A-like enzyme
VRTPFIVRFPPGARSGAVSRSVVSSVDIAPTVLDLAGIEPLPSFQGESFAAVLKDPGAASRRYAFSEHNWHDYRAFERAVTDGRYRYVRNWLTNLPITPPADAVRSPTHEELQRRHESGNLTQVQSQLFDTPVPAALLFDIEADPNCLRNLIDDPEAASVRKRLKEALAEWQRETADKFPGEERLTPDGFDRTTGERLPGVKAPHPSL